MNSLRGTGALLRLAARRDRITLPVWLAALTAMAASSVASVADLYPSYASRLQFAAGAGSNPATIALYGPSSDLATLGGLSTWKLGALGAAAVALMSTFTVIRHTRGNEQAGRSELIGAAVVGRHAALTAATVISLAANLLLAVLTGLALTAGGIPAAGSFAFGFALAATGWVFTGVAAVTAQLTVSSRSANSIAAAVLAVSYLLRAVGDSSGPGSAGRSVSWISPLDWTLAVRSFAAQPHWWVFVLPLAATILLLGIGYRLVAHRDLGAGLIQDRPGPAGAGGGLRSPFALAWRLHRGSLLGWGVGFVLAGAAIGTMASSVSDLAGDNDQVRTLFARMGGVQGLTDAYLAATMSLAGLAAAGYAIQTALRLRTEEAGGQAEALLATPVPRARWMLSHVVVLVMGTVTLLALLGLSAGLAHGLRTGDVAGQLPRLLVAALAQVPAALVVGTLATTVFGLLPRFVTVSWGLLAVFLLLGQFGDLLGLDQRVMDLSPFTHTPKLPGGTLSATPVALLLAVAVLLAGVGIFRFRRRDLH